MLYGQGTSNHENHGQNVQIPPSFERLYMRTRHMHRGMKRFGYKIRCSGSNSKVCGHSSNPNFLKIFEKLTENFPNPKFREKKMYD